MTACELADEAAIRENRHMTELESILQKGDIAISYKWLARRLSVSANTAKRMLFEYADTHKDSVEASYLITGKKDGVYAFGGLRYINGVPGERPVRANISLGDSLAGIHAAFGVCLALLQRERHDKRGQVVDVSIYESVFQLLESALSEYHYAREIRQPSGSTVTGIVPTNTYLCADDKYIVIGGNGDTIFQRLMRCIGREDMASDTGLSDNQKRVKRVDEIDRAIESYTSARASADVIAALEAANVPCSPILSIADIYHDEHYRARGMFESVQLLTDKGARELLVPAMLPVLERTRGQTRWPGPTAVGAHNDEVLGEVLQLGEAEIEQLRARGVI